MENPDSPSPGPDPDLQVVGNDEEINNLSFISQRLTQLVNAVHQEPLGALGNIEEEVQWIKSYLEDSIAPLQTIFERFGDMLEVFSRYNLEAVAQDEKLDQEHQAERDNQTNNMIEFRNSLRNDHQNLERDLQRFGACLADVLFLEQEFKKAKESVGA